MSSKETLEEMKQSLDFVKNRDPHPERNLDR